MKTVIEQTNGQANRQNGQDFWTTTNLDLTIEIRSSDGSHTQYYQNDEDRIRKILRLLITPGFSPSPFSRWFRNVVSAPSLQRPLI